MIEIWSQLCIPSKKRKHKIVESRDLLFDRRIVSVYKWERKEFTTDSMNENEMVRLIFKLKMGGKFC